MELSKDEVFTLINAYRSQRVLWDTNHKGYFNKSIKTKSWQIVADAVGVDLENAKRKMASLLGSFRREKSRGKKKNLNDTNSPMQYKSDWFAFKAFRFLLDPAINSIKLDGHHSLPSADISNNFENESDIYEKTTIASQDEENSEEYVIPESIVCDITQENMSAAFPQPPTPKRKRSMSSLNDSINMEFQPKRDCSSRESHTQNESIRKDATAKFAKYLEAKLNVFNPTASAILIHKINQLIFEAEMSSISQPHAYSMAAASPTSNWNPSPPPLVQIEVSRCHDNEDEEDMKEGIVDTL